MTDPWHWAGVGEPHHPPEGDNPMNREPLITVASITAAVAAVLGLLVAFGVHLTAEQEKAILGVAAVVAPFVVAFIARRKVTPVE